MNSRTRFETEIAECVWNSKYRYRPQREPAEADITDTWRRVAEALSVTEPDARRKEKWKGEFYRILEGFKFLPAGRILAGAGTAYVVTLFNCFVMGRLAPSIPEVFEGLREGAVTLQQGGGVGYDFSTLWPSGTIPKGSTVPAKGVVEYLKLWDAMSAAIHSTKRKSGAMMATLRCDHPDVDKFVKAKQETDLLTNFNLSVMITDEFMVALQRDREWHLVFPAEELNPGGDETGHTVQRQWSGSEKPVVCRIVKTVQARALWQDIMQATYHHAEPGVLFMDRINYLNNLGYCEQISATNPCGEVPLPPYGACNLGSINLTRFVQHPFSDNANVDLEAISSTAKTAVRMLDNVISASRFPLEKQEKRELQTRRIGLGITGLADMLIMLGLHYGEEPAREQAAEVMKTICHSAYRASVEMAREKEPFPLFEKNKYLKQPFICGLPQDIRDGIGSHGIRNSHLISIAPTGSISLLADNVSSGIEPVYDFEYTRMVQKRDGTATTKKVQDYVWRRWNMESQQQNSLPDYFVTATSLSPEQHLEMQAALQPYVDHSISKTINIPRDFPFRKFTGVYQSAYEKGLKGCTTFRPNPVTGAAMEQDKEDDGDNG